MVGKTPYISLFFLIVCLICSLSVHAQSTISLEQASAQLIANGKYSDYVTAVLDLNNTYDPFIGTWQTVYQGRTITFFITKEIVTEFGRTSEDLIVRQLIVDANSNILFNDTNDADPAIFSNYVSSNSVVTTFVDGNPCSNNMLVTITPMISMGSIEVTLGFKFYQQTGSINANICPNGLENTIYADQAAFIATKI